LDGQAYAELKKSLTGGIKFAGAKIFDRPDLDMIELSDPDIDALAYVSDRAMTKHEARNMKPEAWSKF